MRILLLLLFIIIQLPLHAQNRYWVSNVSANWSSNNWSSSPTAAPDGLGAPTATQRAIFNNNHLGNCVIDQSVSIASITMEASYSGQIDLNGFNFIISGNNDNFFYNGSITDLNISNTLNITSTARTFYSGTTFNTMVNCTSSSLFFNGSTFNNNCQFIKNGNSSDNGNGGNTFNGTVNFVNAGAGYLLLGRNNADVFQQDVSFNNTGNSLIYVAYNSTGNIFNGHISVSSTAGQGVRFGQGPALNDAVLANNKLLFIGADGFSAGNLELRNFKQSGGLAQNLQLTGTALLNLEDDTEFDAPVNFVAPQLLTSGTTYNSSALLEKNGLGNNYSAGNNQFNGPTIIKNSGTAIFAFGNGNPDIFNGNLELENSGSYHIYLGYNSPGNIINGNLTIRNLSNTNNRHIFLCSNANSTLQINGITTVYNQGTATSNNIYLGHYGSVNFGNDLVLENSGTGTNSAIFLNDRINANNIYQGNIELTSISGQGIRFGQNGGTAVLAASKNISIGIAGFSSGMLQMRNFSYPGVLNHSFQLTGTGYFYARNIQFGGNFSVVAPRIFTAESNYGGQLYLEKTGASSDYSTGGNVVQGDCQIIHNGSNYLLMGNTLADTFRQNLLIENNATGNLYLANNNTGHYIGGNLSIQHRPTANNSSTILSNRSTCQIQIDGNATVINNGSASNNHIYLGNNGSINFSGIVDMTNSGTGTTSSIYLNHGTTSSNNFGDDIFIQSPNGGGIRFGQNGGSATFAANKIIQLGSLGFSSGNLTFRNFTQLGNLAQNLLLTGSAYLYMYAADWGGNIDFTAPRIYSNGCHYNGNLSLTKTGSINDYSPGGNMIMGDAVLTNNGSSFFVMGNGLADTFNRDLTVINSGSSSMYIANAGLGHYIDGDLNLLQSSANNSTLGIASNVNSSLSVGGNTLANNNGTAANNQITLGNYGSILFNGSLTLNNIGTGTNSRINLNSRIGSINNYQQNIVLNAVNGQGIRFGENGGSGTLAANKTISIGASGFNSGMLTLRNFDQIGPTPQQLNLTGTAYMYVRDANWGGNIQFVAPRMYSGGTLYNGAALLHKTGAGSETSPGGNTFRLNSQITNSGTGSFVMGNGIADIFENNLYLLNSGTANLYIANNGLGHRIDGNLSVLQTASGNNSSIYLCNRTNASLLVQGTSSVVNNSSGTNGRIYLTYAGNSEFKGNLDLQNIGTGANSAIYLNTTSSSGNTFNENIELNATFGQGIRFGENGGSATLAANKLVYVGPLGFSAGVLRFRNFKQLGGTPQNLLLTGTGYMYHRDALWTGNVDFRSPRYYTATTRYEGTAYIEKTGASNDYSPGGNYLALDADIIHSGSNSMVMGNGTADTFQSNLNIENIGVGSLYLANQGPSHYMGGQVFISNKPTATNAHLFLANQIQSNLYVDGSVQVENNGTGVANRIYLGNSGDIYFNGPLQLENIGTGTNSGIYLNSRSNSFNNYQENILVHCTSGLGIRFGDATGAATLAANKTISVQNGFSAGYLYLRNFTQVGNQAQNLQLTNTAAFYSYDSDWGGAVQVEAPRLFTRGTAYRGNTLLEKSGASNDYSFGGNVFYGISELINSANGIFGMGNNAPDIFEKNAYFRNNGQSRMFIAHNSTGNQFKEKVFFYNNATATNNSDCLLNYGGNATSVFADSVYIMNRSTGYNGFNVSSYGQATFNGAVVLSNLGSHNSNYIHINRISNSSLFNENIIVESTTGNGIYFGQAGGSTTLNTGKSIIVGPAGFNQGNLYLRNFTQVGTSPQQLTLTGSATLTHYNANWNGAVLMAAPRHILRSSTFNNTADLSKTGPQNDYSFGGCTFNGNTILHNSSNARMIVSNNAPNDYNAHVTFRQSGSGLLYPSYNQVCTFAADINIDFPSGQPVYFGANNSARIIFDGNQLQAFNDLGNSEIPLIRNMTVQQIAGDIQLNTAIEIIHDLQLNNGIIYNDLNSLVRLRDNAYVSAVSDASFVNGPVEKLGNDAFTFPVGKSNLYRPCAISAPNSGAAAFRAEYFQNSPNPSYNTNLKEASIDFVSTCEYWMIDRTAGNSSATITLSWNDQTSCGIKNLPAINVVRWDGSLWRDHGNSNPTLETVSSAGPISNFSPFTLSIFDPGLPVELIHFDVERAAKDLVDLHWITDSEINNTGFEIQRMHDDETTFSSIGWLDGHGTTNIQQVYNWTDNNAHRGISYYRLKQIDTDGAYTYSEVKAVEGLSASSGLDANIYPNPVVDHVIVEVGALGNDCNWLTIEIVAANGQKIMDYKTDANPYQNYQFDMPVAAGVYFIHLSTDKGDQKSYKIIKIN